MYTSLKNHPFSKLYTLEELESHMTTVHKPVTCSDCGDEFANQVCLTISKNDFKMGLKIVPKNWFLNCIKNDLQKGV